MNQSTESQAFPSSSLNRHDCPFGVTEFPTVVAKIELIEVSVQMLSADVVERPDDSPFQ